MAKINISRNTIEFARTLAFPYFFSIALLIFALSFFLVEGTGRRTTIFYVACAIPALVAAPLYVTNLLHNSTIRSLWFFLFVHTLAIWITDGLSKDSAKEWLLIVLLYICLISGMGRKRSFDTACLVFFFVSTVIGLYAIGGWSLRLMETGDFSRVTLHAALSNPVHAALIILTGWLGFWFVYALPRCRQRGHVWLSVGYLALIIYAVAICMVFQARSALVGAGLSVLTYMLIHKEWKVGFAIVVIAGVTLGFLGLGDTLSQRGLSYRLDIWHDVWSRVMNECSWLLGCGRSDKHMYLEQFHHPHSAYLSTLAHAGFIGFLAFACFAALFIFHGFRAKSSWFALAMLGWGGVLTTSFGLVISPDPLWIYFWIPTLIAIISYPAADSNRTEGSLSTQT